MDNTPDRSTEQDTKIIPYKLPCILTEEERMARGREQAREVIDLHTVQEAKKIAAQEFGAKEKMHTKRIGELSHIVDSGSEVRTVDCSVRFDYYLGRVIVTRTDTGVVIENRPMTHKEAQKKLDLGDD